MTYGLIKFNYSSVSFTGFHQYDHPFNTMLIGYAIH